MKKIYISGKITGLELCDAERLFNEAESKCIELGFVPVNPIKLNHAHDKTWLSYMKEDIIAMMECDAIFMLSNYKTSKGAMIELELAKELGFSIYFDGDAN